MSRSLSYLRRGLLGIAFVGSLGFGVAQAFAGPATAPSSRLHCTPMECYAQCEGLCIRDPVSGHLDCVCNP